MDLDSVIGTRWARTMVLLLLCSLACHAQLITTFAGGGSPTVLGDGGPATLAFLSNPASVAFDGAGNLYIAEYSSSRIRKVTPAGTITTYAGNGNDGFSGDTGPATLATLSHPAGIAVDAAGNLYIADYYNQRIRKVTVDGKISTVAGNGKGDFYGDGLPATSAALNGPQGVAVDAAGNLYIADFYNHRIRKVTPDGKINTVAGSGKAAFSGDGGPATLAALNYPGRVVVDAAGNLYIADHDNHRIRKVTLDGTINTIAGGGNGNLGDGGPATLASLYGPYGVAVDSAGNVYIGDTGYNRARKVTPDGLINTVAGDGDNGFSGDGGPATAAALNQPQGVALDAKGSLYIADARNNRIRKVYFPTPTSSSLSSSLNPSKFGQNVTLTAAVSPPAATGTVSFKEGTAALGGGSLSGGKATLTLSMLSPGPHSLTATYNGDPNFDANTSPALTQIINPADTTITLRSSANPSGSGQTVILTATVLPSSATGTVTFLDGSTTLSSSQLDNGTATLSLSALSIGAHFVTVVYSGDANYATSTSTPLTQNVNQATSTTTLSPSANPSAFGQSLTLTAAVSPLSATGNVTFKDGQATLSSIPLDGGTATLTLTTLAAGTHSLTAIYGGDLNYTSSTSMPPLLENVNGASPVAPCTPKVTYVVGQPAPGPVVCQFTALLSASFTVNTTASWLQVNPSSGLLDTTPTSFSLFVDPTGLASGSYTGSFTISGPQLGSLTVPVLLTVTSGKSTLLATPTSLSFTYQQGSSAPPAQPLIVSSSIGTQLPFAITATGGSWLIAGIAGGNSPVTFNVFTSPIGLAPNVYSGTLAISSPDVPSVTVNVTLTVTVPVPPKLSVTATASKLSGLRGGPPSSAQIQVSNAGGGVLNFTASTSGGAWLSVSPASGTLDNSQPSGASPISLTITGDPTSLAAGTYQGSVSVSGGGTSATIPITFSVADPKPVILVSQSGLSFTAVSQGGGPMLQQIGVLNTGNGTLNWSATVSTLSGGNWLLISTPGGTVQQPFLDVSPTNVSIDPSVAAALDPGDYYGQIQITNPVAINSPQLVTVILTVLPPGEDPGPEASPSGLIFTGPPGASPVPQNVMVGIRKAAADQYVSSHIPGSPFNYSPAISPVQPNQPVSVQVVPDFSALNPLDIKRDTITLQFNDGTPRTISLLTVVAPDASGSSGLAPQAASNCATLILQWRTPSPPTFTVVQGRGQTLELQVVDSCGNLIGPSNPRNASLQATFSNKDSDLSLVHIGNGIWTGTWKPVNPSAGLVTVIVTAFNSTGTVLQSGQSTSLSANVVTSTTPLVTAGGVQHAASYVLGAPIAPGTLITLKGLNLANADSATSGLPLPTLWNGTQVFMGTEPLPLLFTASGQVNVQVPYEVPVNTQFQVTVQRDNLQSLPEQLVIAAAQPGIFTADASGIGQGVIYKSDGVTLSQPGTPATAGEKITIFCTGLGTVTPPVPAGTQPPESPVSTTDNPVAVTIGGQDGKATAGTLVPGRPGVYTVAAIVPAGVTGDAVPVVLTVAGQTSPLVTMAVQ